MCLFQANLFDHLFCCFMIFACQQLEHIKEALRPLLEMTTNIGGGTDIFRVTDDNVPEEPIISKDGKDRFNNLPKKVHTNSYII